MYECVVTGLRQKSPQNVPYNNFTGLFKSNFPQDLQSIKHLSVQDRTLALSVGGIRSIEEVQTGLNSCK